MRVFHDFGLVGVAFLLVAIASPIAAAARWLPIRSDHQTAVRALHLASILAAFGLALEMITDNSLVYEFVVAPPRSSSELRSGHAPPVPTLAVCPLRLDVTAHEDPHLGLCV